MSKIEVSVYCYWNGCIKYGPEGVYYEGPTPKKIIVNPKIALNKLLDEMYGLTGVDVDKQRTKVKIFGRYPSVVGQSKFQYLLLPVVNDHSLETMLEVTRKHPSIKNVELYLEVKSEEVIGPADYSSKQMTCIPVKVESVNIGDAVDSDFGDVKDADMIYNISSSDVCVSKPSLWFGDHDLRVGLCFKDVDELKKAVDWCSIKGMQKCVVRETQKEELMFECIKWRCKWSLRAAKMETNGPFEIIKYNGPHTCPPTDPKHSDSEFQADEIERLVRRHPTLSFSEIKNWWKANIGYDLETSEVRVAKEEAIKRVFGGQSFEDLPRLMSAFQSSNGLLVDWKYDLFPNPMFASFCGVFWAFTQSVEGFQYCIPLILVDTKEVSDKHQLKLMVAAGVDAEYNYLPLAFAVTKQVSTDSWRWFLTNIREKVTQRKGLCLISSSHPDILSVINEPGSQWKEPWAYHRFCLKQFSSQFCSGFPGDNQLENLVEQAGSTSQKEEFETHIERIKEENPEARRRLDQIPQNLWALVHDGDKRYGIMEINRECLFTECRGFELDGQAVIGSVMLLFDELRDWFDNRSHRSRGSLNSGDVYTEPVADKLEEFRTATATYIVVPLDNNVFKVAEETSEEDDEWIVLLSDCSSCTCGAFQRYKFPCMHALAVCKQLKINPLQYVDNCYTFESNYKTYAATFSHVPELSAWPEASGVPRLFPPVIPKLPPPSPPSSSNGSDDDHAEEGGKIIFFGEKNHLFDLNDLLRFSAEVLGKGAFGTTIKGITEDISTVVVKLLKEVVVERREFEQQMEIIGMIRHENVAELQAYHYSKDYKLAIYSYYSQGSLFEMLHGNRGMNDRVPLDWEARLRIATGAARGLAKIHGANDGTFNHGNVKSSNIFLDSQSYGCIGDTGLATIMKSVPQTTCLASGYHAPEITDTRRSTQSSDIYSFGVVLLELLTGKSPASQETKDGENMDLVTWIWTVAKECRGEVLNMEILSELGGTEEEMVRMMQIGLACIAVEPQERPHVAQVVKMVEDIRPTDAAQSD